MKKITLLACVALSLSLTGCMNKEQGGTLLGGIGGAVAGAQFGKGSGKLIATAVGALGGAYVGNQIGQSLDKADRLYADRTMNSALETAHTGQAVAWQNPDSRNSGSFTPVRTFQEPNSGQYCREYQQTVIVGGKSQQAYGKACRMPDGTWKIAQ
jgi:surface antigen